MCEDRNTETLMISVQGKQTMLTEHSDSVEAFLLQRGKVSSFVRAGYYCSLSVS